MEGNLLFIIIIIIVIIVIIIIIIIIIILLEGQGLSLSLVSAREIDLPAGIALGIMETHKLPYHYKATVHSLAFQVNLTGQELLMALFTFCNSCMWFCVQKKSH